MLVMGSMIGSGIFIVSAEIAASRIACPADRSLAGYRLPDHRRRAELWRTGSHDAARGWPVCLSARVLGPLWGFLYGWTLFLVIQTGTIAAVGVAFGKFLGIFFPSISSTNWIVHFWKVPPIHIGPMVLGNMETGLSTQNLVAILVVVVVVGHQYFWIEDRGADPECFYRRQSFRLVGTGGSGSADRAQRAGASQRIFKATSGITPV